MFLFQVDQLTDIARRDSFSSISSCGQREQFKTALDKLQHTVFGKEQKRDKTPTNMDVSFSTVFLRWFSCIG